MHSFNGRNTERFAEPVSEFSHSRNVPLVCFIINVEGDITHIGLGKRGVRAGTDLRRLNIYDIFELENEISAQSIAESTPSRFKSYLLNRTENGGLIATKSFEEFLSIFLEKAEDAKYILNKYSKERKIRIAQLSKLAKRNLAEQKEAVLTAMNIAGINKEELQGWDFIETESSSFLDGINNPKIREDSMIINDLTNLPGFDLMKSSKFSSSVFKNDKTKLTVLLANRLPLEELLGTDFIYYNEDFKCFVMVQYKVMEKENEKFVFRLPNEQFTEEIKRMDSVMDILSKTLGTEDIHDYRINNIPFYIKICPRIEFHPDNVGLSSGLYLPIDYLKLLQSDNSILGSRGGRAITFDNVGRYMDNTSFKSIIEGGWIGTNHNQSQVLEQIIRKILENGRTAVFAIKKEMQRNHEIN
ncbi:hypothetical protein MM213_00010 [Belliella sp. R4-6]|uniref:Uncharacterized protein n=1 Tax=Belliella alkalica TaxID=1730871 RepID=A0ABS9V5Z8_9BACT|nr:hypothetical protein [Belliella alkalica]MCH7411851.1 hypothetical protein [Belliella alkalica]